MRKLARGLAWTACGTYAAVAAVAAGVSVWLLVIWATLPDEERVPAEGPPGETAFMKADRARCNSIDRTWRPIGDISPLVACSIVRAEDRRFFLHRGVDWIALRGAAEDALRAGEARLGGSTIAMQLARNLFFARERTLTRKARELSVAPRLVERLGRRRVLELYLNVAEWAPCRYGVEEAARWWLGHGAERMDLFEATLLAALLPRPHTPLAPDDATRVARRQGILMRQLQRAGLMSRDQLEAELQELDRSWRVLVKTGDADGLRAALHARASEPPTSSAIDGRGWLEAECGRVW